jgi:hypothetical protein
MVDWAVTMSPCFSEAVDLVVRGPSVKRGLGTLLYRLKIEQREMAEVQPEAVLRLIEWLLLEGTGQWTVSTDIQEFVFSLPKKRTLLPQLINICQRLASLGDAGAGELKRRVEVEFTLE